MSKAKDLSRVKWSNLTSQQKYERGEALRVLSIMRRDSKKFLTYVAKELGITPYKVKKHLGRYIRKKKGRWVASKKDRIERSMRFYEKGNKITIKFKSSSDASIIGNYFNAVKNFLATGNEELLNPFKKIVIVDSEEKEHKLETNPEKIYEIDEKLEDSDTIDVFSSNEL